MPVSGPERCPQCNYDLHGVPVPHRCPECGLAYDEHTRIWRPARPWRILVTALPLALLGWWAIRSLASSRWYAQLGGALLGIVVCFGLAALLWKILRSNRVGRFVALTPDGILIRTHAFAVLIPWQDFKRAHIEGLHILILDGGVERKSIDLAHLLNVEELQQLAHEIRLSKACRTPPSTGPNAMP